MADEPTTTRAMPTNKILRPRGRPDVDGDRESGCWFIGGSLIPARFAKLGQAHSEGHDLATFFTILLP
jgi:hypothetical protein